MFIDILAAVIAEQMNIKYSILKADTIKTNKSYTYIVLDCDLKVAVPRELQL